eukprot:7381151-Prymnesium_polylepis.1
MGASPWQSASFGSREGEDTIISKGTSVGQPSGVLSGVGSTGTEDASRTAALRLASTAPRLAPRPRAGEGVGGGRR